MDIAELGLSIRSDGVVVASDRLKKFGQDAERAEKATNQLVNVFRTFAPLAGTVMAAFSARALRQYADEWSDMQSRIGAAVKNMEAAPALMERIVDIANASYSPLAQTAEVYSRNMATLSDYGKSANEAADFTEALNHALVITATKGQDADVVLNAYSRAISNGKLRTMEFETIMSRSPRLLEAVADKLGTNVTGLRALAAAGKVTGADLIAGPIESLELLRKEAADMPATVGDALQRIGTNFQAMVGRVDQATGSSESFASSMIGLADAIRAGTDDIVRVALVIQTGLNAAMEWASSAAATLGGTFDSASAMIVAGAGAAGFAVTALTGAITMGLLKAMAALALALLANPFALFIGGIAAAVTASYLFRDQIKQVVGVDALEVFKDIGNKIIGVMVGAYNAVVEAWGNLPAAFKAIGKQAWNTFIEEFEKPALTVNGMTIIPGLNLSALKADITALDKEALDPVVAKFKEGFDTNYIGNFSSAIGEAWANADGAIAGFDGLAASAGNVGQAIDEKAAKAARKLAEAYKRIVEAGQDFVRQQQLEAGLIGMNEQAANALRYEFDLLNEARRAGIKLTEADRHGFKALAEAMAEAEENTRHLRVAFDFTKDTIKGFFSDLRSGLMEGKSFFEALGQAGLNAINKIADRLMDLALDQIINGFLKNLMGSFGGVFGGGSFGGGASYFPSIPGAGLYQSGGWTGDGPVGQAAGVVHGQEFVVKAGPAARNRAALEAINAGVLPSANNNQPAAANGNAPIYADNRVFKVDARGAQVGVAEQITRALKSFSEDVLPVRVNQIANDPYARG